MGLEKIHQAIVDGSVGIKTVVDYAAKIDSKSFESDAISASRKARKKLGIH